QNSGVHFEVTVEFTTVDPAKTVADPLARPPEINWGGSEATEPYFLDRSKPDPKPKVNTAGDPFEQDKERECGEMTITITINEPTHDAALADTYSHTTNLNDVTIDGTIYAAGTLK